MLENFVQPYFLTTPIYYVNAKPHIGHAYTTLIADSLVRFQRMMGREAFLVTGTDEHGDKIVQAAEKAGESPQVFTDAISAEFKAMWEKLDIQVGRFIRTTEPHHKAAVQKILQKVYDSGDIYFGEYGGHYCLGCERFYTEKELTEEGLCPQHLVKPQYISEKNYFFKMSKYQDWLREYILANPDFIRPERYRTEALSLLDSGALEDLCISRPKSRLTWGIELPFDADYVCYVWFDALISYISAINWPDGKEFATFWPGAQHLVAKDILKPHAIFWPTMLKAAGIEPYQNLNVHGYWLTRNTKMSKSLGNVVNPLEQAEKYGYDAFRYFLLREMHFGSDADFTEEALVARFNADLANDLGNLYSRVLGMTAKYFDSVVPPMGVPGEREKDLLALAENSFRNFQDLFGNVRFSNALESLWELVRALNKYVDSAAPWTLAKEGKTGELQMVMYTLLEFLRKIALHLLPVMPKTAQTLLEQLGQNVAPESVLLPEELGSFGALQPGLKVAAASNLFPRVEKEKTAPAPKEAKAVKEPKPAGEPKTPATATAPGSKALIEYDDFQKLDIRVGTVVAAEQHPNADKLLRLEIDLGEEKPRQIVSGIAAHYDPKALVGAQVTVVANLAPRKLRGLESQGMILTADTGSGLELLTVNNKIPGGSTVS
ncbi:Methionine--tRNA ligase [uncultured delta proteobacterium]|uniref:Methionine--tRNA ligase n=1 Tax=uncultured delta proteobacterium TaxID=34034 RepID=A0A212J6M7_9DELT|nr:Methionine--tRNA ligase [uncultured delta proteobacterium]